MQHPPDALGVIFPFIPIILWLTGGTAVAATGWGLWKGKQIVDKIERGEKIVKFVGYGVLAYGVYRLYEKAR